MPVLAIRLNGAGGLAASPQVEVVIMRRRIKVGGRRKMLSLNSSLSLIREITHTSVKVYVDRDANCR